MLDGLGGGDQSGIEDLFVVDFACNIVGLFDNAINSGARDASNIHSYEFEDALEASNMSLRLFEVGLEARPKIGISVALSTMVGSAFKIWFSA